MADMSKKLGFDAEFLRLGRQNKPIDDRPFLCGDCFHCRREYQTTKERSVDCELTHAVVLGVGCSLRNKDLSNEKICLNCRHFLGGMDWGLSCAKEYHRLTEPLESACEDFEVEK